MTFRSRLFATVALPVLSTALIATPTLADALMKPFEVAQESAGEGQPSEEELLLQQQQQQQDESQRAADEEQQRQAEEQKAAEEAERAAAEQKAAEDEAARATAEEQQRQAEEQKAAEEAEKAAAEQKAAEDEAARAAAEEEQRQAEEQKAAEEADKAAAEQKAAEDEAARAAAEEEQQKADEQKAAEEQKPAEDQQAEQPAVDDGGAAETTAEQPATGEGEQQPAVAGEETPAETGTDRPATVETGETPAGEPVPEVVDTMSEEQKQEIAEDPGKTDETVVLPVENGAAVLDSDKDADNAGGQKSRETRRKQREELRAQEEEVPVPETDDAAQAAITEEVREAVPQKIEAAIKEEGRRVKEAPDFEVPETTNIINNTVITNNTVNNTTIDNSVTAVNIVERVENRTVLEVGDRLIVRGDDRPRLRRDSEEVYYDNLARGRVRETIVRPGGVQIVTIYNRYGDIIQRSRVGRDGQEYILVYAPELEEDAPRPGLVDVGYELPPMRLRIPVSDYIIDTSSDPDRDYYAFLAEPPVERVERVYTIDEVKHSARLRDKVRRIDLDTITFATASAEVPMSQARTLRSVAEAMQKVLDKDPGETFLIEGHTDAVGSDKSNLVLSDERAESVASLLTEVYGVPPENLQTQGYGERFLKVKTADAEQQNRRVTIRRVTTLVRPMARAN
jgi:outer membrane protein OmpA-like peptidoglycan-associated protein